MFINVERKWQKEIYQRYWQAEIKLKTAKSASITAAANFKINFLFILREISYFFGC